MGARQREIRITMIKCCVLPLCRVMTRRADHTELTVMSIILCVAGNTFLGRAFIHTVDVTPCTWHTGMRTSQRESRYLAMIEIHILPSGWVMACATIRTKLAVMRIIRSMTGKTIGRGAFVNTIHVTGSAWNTFMAAHQRETSERAMIEIHILPSGWVMAFRAIHAHFALVNIQVARSTGGWRALESKVFMAA